MITNMKWKEMNKNFFLKQIFCFLFIKINCRRLVAVLKKLIGNKYIRQAFNNKILAFLGVMIF